MNKSSRVELTLSHMSQALRTQLASLAPPRIELPDASSVTLVQTRHIRRYHAHSGKPPPPVRRPSCQSLARCKRRTPCPSKSEPSCRYTTYHRGGEEQKQMPPGTNSQRGLMRSASNSWLGIVSQGVRIVSCKRGHAAPQGRHLYLERWRIFLKRRVGGGGGVSSDSDGSKPSRGMRVRPSRTVRRAGAARAG